MKVEARVFLGLAAFFWLAAAAYGIWTDQARGHVEVAGFTALILSGGLMFVPGSFFWFVLRRIDPRPEDRNDAEIAEARASSASSARVATGPSALPSRRRSPVPGSHSSRCGWPSSA